LEALVRWRHPVRGIMAPSRFLPLAEEAGLMDAVGEAVLDASLRQLAEWRVHRPDLSLSWNLSPSELVSPGLLAMVTEVLRRWRLPAGALDVEVSEGTYSAIIGTALQVAAQLRRLGVGVTLDDFGTGYSSLAYLSRFPLDMVKIDRSFVAGIGNPTDETVLRAVLELGDLLGLRVVAEGVETEEQLAVVRSLGCRHVQGYLVSPPLPAAALDLDEVTEATVELVSAMGRGAA
jgi:EAL domain-containing protein (putative c-di-GMP-specific phosphodiesterase class I)